MKEKNKPVKYEQGYLLSEVGVLPKTMKHVIYILNLIANEKSLTEPLVNGLGVINLYCFDSWMEDQWRILLSKYCRFRKDKL